MLTTASIVAFVPSTDLARSRAFYEGVLGLSVVGQDAFAVVVRAGDVPIRITNVGTELRAQPFTVLGWEVDDVHAEVRQLTGRGVELVVVEGMGQDDDAVWAAPDGTHVAWFRDPDGNTLSVTSPSS